MIDTRPLKQARKEANLTQAEIAKKIGVSRETVVAIENEYPNTIRSLPITTVKRWVKATRESASESTMLHIQAVYLEAAGF